MTALQRLAQELRSEGGILAGTVADPESPQPHGDAVASKGDEYPLLVEAIREGYLQHYAEGRVVQPEDPDLALLAGDRLYALGLERLAAIGDLEAVAELADVIALCAQAHAEGDHARAEAVWEAGARAVATGPSPDHEATKRQWRGA
ncbi:ATP-binding protein [Solirubrobacter taibaiensis]|nr:ATP-binding protein [Solirubrobacter taibaiensis]